VPLREWQEIQALLRTECPLARGAWKGMNFELHTQLEAVRTVLSEVSESL
jgi:hypothetical protein